jgi:hypothetical protein
MTDLKTAEDYTKQAEYFAKKAMDEEDGTVSIRYVELGVLCVLIATVKMMREVADIARKAQGTESQDG